MKNSPRNLAHNDGPVIVPAAHCNRAPADASFLPDGFDAAEEPSDDAPTPLAPADEPPRLSDLPAEQMEDPLAGERLGPLSSQGIKVRPDMSLTLGDFQILKKVGAGGMGAVYRAHQVSRKRQVALKVLSRYLAAQAAYVERFYREASMLASLDHPNIVGFYGAGEEKGFPYFAMEYIDGFSAAVLLKHMGNKLAIGDVLHIVLRCAAGLRYAHERNIMHRDIKPENILITYQGDIKIADLGLAKPMNEDLSLTDTNTSLGTPKYMAPEQARNAKHADHRCDIYALGGVLYALLTGQAPFQGSTALELLLAKERGLFPSARRLNPEVPTRLDLMVDKMLAREPKRRYQSCAELISDLERLDMAHGRLSFNPRHVLHGTRPPVSPAPEDLVEILLIHNDPDDILLAQQALQESGTPSNLRVVEDGREALALLRRQGKYAHAPRPNLIILGSYLLASGSLEMLEEIRHNRDLRTIPLVVLTTSPRARDVLKAHGFEVNLTVTKPDDLEDFQNLIKSVQGLSLTLVERPVECC
jgi:serine/threonine protein kinase